MLNHPAIVAKVGHAKGGRLHVLRWSSGHVGISDGVATHRAHVLNGEHAKALGEALIAATKPAPRVR